MTVRQGGIDKPGLLTIRNMEFDLGMAMAIPFPLFSNPTYPQPAAKEQAKDQAKNQVKDKLKVNVEEDQGFVSDSEDSFPSSPELNELRVKLKMFRTEEAKEKAAGVKEAQWKNLEESAKRGPAIEVTDEGNSSIFANAADIINRLTGNLDPKELQEVTQSSLEKFYSSMQELQTTIEDSQTLHVENSQEHCSMPCSPRFNHVSRVTVEDDSGHEFRHLFDELQTKDGLLAGLMPFSLRNGIWNALADYIKQVFGGYIGHLVRTAKALMPRNLSYLIWPAVSYLMVLVFIGVLSKAVIANNWERVKDDAQALLSLFKKM
ncbi:hypothetical protein DSO57_1031555 [Entomophthora muscae]|uniref:Uncharacterized protein n=1 Tax=Entomophthora muscae TaxID=34485 RepID=A0ACC2SPP2_9FUNG|nr:hypothetical protein DSO57_1031555 [Entomophthora muscae]